MFERCLTSWVQTLLIALLLVLGGPLFFSNKASLSYADPTCCCLNSGLNCQTEPNLSSFSSAEDPLDQCPVGCSLGSCSALPSCSGSTTTSTTLPTTTTTTTSTTTSTTSTTTTTLPACTYEINPTHFATCRNVPGRTCTETVTNIISGTYPSCVQNVLSACGASANHTSANAATSGGCKDDCVVGVLSGQMAAPTSPVEILTSCRGSAFDWGWMNNPGNNPIGVIESINAGQSFWDAVGTFYLDASCNVVPAGNVCGSANLTYALTDISSPISLMWDKGDGEEDPPTVVNFPLVPGGKVQQLFAWHASGRAPLLVYDPEHTGVITEASQLFGNYTFYRAWRNGYEALSTLDLNSDRVLSGKELEDLALWFDRNKNGISEPGEVISLGEAGVTKIYTKFDRKQNLTGDLIATKGFDRIIDGKTVTGSSVDWFVLPVKDPPVITVQNVDDSNISGSWIWTAIEDGDDSPISTTGSQGVFLLKDYQGLLMGMSLVESPAEPNPGPAQKIVRLARLQGTRSDDGENSVRIKFELYSGDGNRAVSEATLLGGGLKGTTRHIRNGETIMSYSWVARRN